VSAKRSGPVLTRAQFVAAARADEKWVENTTRALGRRLAYTSDEARWMGVVRLLAHDFGIPVARAGELADEALRHPPETRALPLAESNEGAVTLMLDLARYHSTFAAALSAALSHGGHRRRGRPPAARPHRRDALGAAESHGVDVSLLRAALSQSPGERLERLDANAEFLRALRPSSPHRGPTATRGVNRRDR
jgi:hypothetical protein